jgi:tetratricopeptide (TPR) repeat protein
MRKAVVPSFLARISFVAALGLSCGWMWIHQAPAAETPTQDDYSNLSGSYLSGEFARMQGDEEEAIRHMERARARSPENNIAIDNQLLVLYLRSGNTDKAVEIARKNEHASDRELISDMLLAIDDAKHEDYGVAEHRLKDTFGPSGLGTLWLPLVVAWLDAGQGKLKKPLGIDDVTKEKVSPGSFIYYHLALVNDYGGFRKEAQDEYIKAIGNRGSVPYRVAEVVKNFYARGDGPIKSKEAAKAMEVVAAAIPDGEDSIDVSVEGVQPSDMLDSDVPPPRVVGSVQEGMAEVFYTMGSILYSSGSADDAMLYLRLALFLRPDFPMAQLMLGNVLEEEENYAAANKVYAGINAGSPLYEKGQLRSAFGLEKLGHPDDAQHVIDALMGKSPDMFSALVAKGDLLRIRGKYADAADAYTKALATIKSLQPAHWAVLYARGACFERAGNWKPAEEDLLKALDLSPNQPDVLNYLGYSWLTRNERLDEARGMLERAIKSRPDDPQIIDSIGWAMYKSGDFKSALHFLEQAIDLMPNDPTVNEHLGDVYWKTGRRTEARFQWERALVYSPDAPQATQIRQKLKEGIPDVISEHTSKNNAGGSALEQAVKE